MIHFQWPWMTLLLLLPLLKWLLQRHRSDASMDQQQRNTTLLHPALTHLQAAFHTDTPSRTTGSLLHTLLLSLLWLGLVTAMTRPQWLEAHTEQRTEGYDLMLAVDASHSMGALDFSVDGKQVSRMQVIKGVLERFIGGRENDRIGLIVFGDRAYVLSPLTLDRPSVLQLLANLVPDIAGGYTAMGDALGVGVKKLRQRPPGSRVLLLIADGENTAGTIPPLEAARLAAKEGIRIYTIGVGSTLEEVPIMEQGRLNKRRDLGFDEAIMREIASISDGAYFRATDTRALQNIYQRIDELEKSRVESRTLMVPHPLYRWPLALALFCLLILGLFPGARLRQLTRGQDHA